MSYPVRKIPFNTRDYADYRSLQRIAAFTKGANAGIRQMAIDYVVTAHAFSKKHTKSLRYSANLQLPGSPRSTTVAPGRHAGLIVTGPTKPPAHCRSGR